MNKTHIFLLVFIIITGFLFRIIGASRIPYIHDELTKDKITSEISLYGKWINIPIGSKETNLPLLSTYLMKLGYIIFGKGEFGARIFIVILATFGLYFIYALANLGLGREKAFYALFLTTFCQFHIGWSRINEEDSLLLFFIPGMLYFLYKAIIENRRNWLIIGVIFLSLGIYAKPTILLIIPCVFLYCIILKEYRKFIFDIKNYSVILGIPLIFALPYIYWNYLNDWCDFRLYLNEINTIKFSIIPITLFLGEAIVYLTFWLDDNQIKYLTSPEYPFMHWPLGLLCIIGVFYAFKYRKTSFMSFLLVIFFTITGILSLIRSHGYIHFDEFWWASPLFTPGIIFAANLLVDLKNKFKKIKIVVSFFLFYLIFHSLNFIIFPENCFVPRKNIIAEHLFERADFYISEGRKDKAEKLYKMIIKIKPKKEIVNKVNDKLFKLSIEKVNDGTKLIK